MTRDDFIGQTENWNSHRTLLWEALQLTSGPVIELGMGKGSTLQLHNYCEEHERVLESYDNNKEYVDEFKWLETGGHRIFHAPDWDDVSLDCDVLFVDHAPGERRKVDIERAAFKAQIIVAHDTEPNADHGYQMRAVLKTFKYIKEHETDGAWTTMVSNFIDVSKF